jgi:hypothetical protein
MAHFAEGFEPGRLVSVRRIPEQLVTDQTRERLRLVEEGCVELSHPSLVKLLSVQEANGMVLSISENIQGVLLFDFLRHLMESQSPMPTAVAVRIIRDAARAGITARRLADQQGLFKGQRLLYNDAVFVANYGDTLLRDVGVLTELGRASTVRELPEVIVGLSPEELSGPRVVHVSSEVFSLASFLWELLANRPLFSRRDVQRATSSVISQPVPPLDRIARLGGALPRELVGLVARALDRDPRRRTPSLEAFVEAIDELRELEVFDESFIASTEQVEGYFYYLAEGVLGELAPSSRWSVGAKSDYFAIDSTSTVTKLRQEDELDSAPITTRQFLTATTLESNRLNDMEERLDDGNRLDASENVDSRRNGRLTLWGLLVFLAIVILGVVLYGAGFLGA